MFQCPAHVVIISDQAAGKIGEMKEEKSGERCFDGQLPRVQRGSDRNTLHKLLEPRSRREYEN